ncbi:MAG: hypothetical protein SGPRY_002593, partial [Prymnesium sp.]
MEGGAPGPTQVVDRQGLLNPRPTPMQEFIALHPLPYAIVSARMLLISAAVVLCLVLHNFVLLLTSFEDDVEGKLNPYLRLASSMRVLAALPRPLLWWRIFTLYSAAAREHTTLRVAQRLLAALRDPWVRCNAVLNNVYNVWLGIMIGILAFRYFQTPEMERSQFERALCWHVC